MLFLLKRLTCLLRTTKKSIAEAKAHEMLKKIRNIGTLSEHNTSLIQEFPKIRGLVL